MRIALLLEHTDFLAGEFFLLRNTTDFLGGDFLLRNTSIFLGAIILPRNRLYFSSWEIFKFFPEHIQISSSRRLSEQINLIQWLLSKTISHSFFTNQNIRKEIDILFYKKSVIIFIKRYVVVMQ